MTLPRLGAALVISVGVALTATACSGSATPATTATGTVTAAAPSSPVATPSGSAVPDATAKPTCETIIPASTVADFRGLRWTAQQAPFYLGDTQLAGGIQCTWGDYSVASDHVQVFGWAPLTDDQAATSRAALLADGWREIDENGVVFLSESADTVVAPDADGYGMTYLFGDGWVKVADTKQGLLLVEWPKT